MSHQSCPYCLGEITLGQEKTYCSRCGAAHHLDCWAESGHCAVLGCAGDGVPPVTPEAPERPAETNHGPTPIIPAPPAGPQGTTSPPARVGDAAGAAAQGRGSGSPSGLNGPAYTSPAPQPAAALPGRGGNKRTYVALGILAGAVVFLALIAVVVTSLGKGEVLEDAVAACDLESNSYAQIGDDGDSLLLDMEGEGDSDGLTFSYVMCVLEALEMPDSVENRMGQTTSMDGMQDASWESIHASWKYHPDDGLDVILERE
jgi:hypothetical protein